MNIYKKILALLLLAALCSACSLITVVPSEPPGAELSLHVISVGKADALLLACDGQYARAIRYPSDRSLHLCV